MRKIILILSGLFWVGTNTFGQVSRPGKMLFVIDSIPIINDPEPWNEILAADIADVAVIRDKELIKELGLGKIDSVTYMFTKEYRKRPDSIKKIPSLKQMKMENDRWLFHETPYSGKYIDYYNSGRKQNEGNLLNGKLDGRLRIYYQNGNLGSDYNYKEGMADGVSMEYYKNGALRQIRGFRNGKDDGVWETYFPGGQPEHRGTVHNGSLVDSAINYYSTGEISGLRIVKNGKVVPNPLKEKIDYLQNKVYESLRAGYTKDAIKYCSKMIALDSANAGAYLLRGMAILNASRFDEAMLEFDKALKIEPLLKAALIQRAVARMGKYQFGNGHTVSKNKKIMELISSKENMHLPEGEKEKICSDLLQADLLQTMYLTPDTKFVNETLLNFCNKDVRR